MTKAMNSIKSQKAQNIIKTVARHYNVTPYDIKTKFNGKDRQVTKARQIAMTLCQHMATLTYEQIADQFRHEDEPVRTRGVINMNLKKGKELSTKPQVRKSIVILANQVRDQFNLLA